MRQARGQGRHDRPDRSGASGVRVTARQGARCGRGRPADAQAARRRRGPARPPGLRRAAGENRRDPDTVAVRAVPDAGMTQSSLNKAGDVPWWYDDLVSTQFSDLDDYVRIPRVGGLAMAPDGRRLVVGVATRDPGKNRYVTALWEVDPAGERPARRLTRSADGESGAAFMPAGDLLFVSKREDEKAALWLLPADGGEAHVV